MSNLKVINEQEILGKHFTMYGTYEQPLFLAKDVAEWIEHSNTSKMLSTIDDEEKVNLPITISYTQEKQHGGIRDGQNCLFLTEDGLYEVLMQSRKPIAKQFKKEVKAILKQIRQTGGYVQEDRELEFIEKYFPSFTDDTKLTMVEDLYTQNKKYKTQITQLEAKANALKSKSDAFDDLMNAQGYIKFIDLAQSIEIGRTKLFDFLRKCKVITKQSNFNTPYGRFATNGYFRVVHSKDDKGHYSTVTLVSPKGTKYIHKLIVKAKLESEFDIKKLLLASKSIQEVA